MPQQRERQLPSAADVDAMRTPPVDEVLEAFREQKAAGEHVESERTVTWLQGRTRASLISMRESALCRPE